MYRKQAIMNNLSIAISDPDRMRRSPNLGSTFAALGKIEEEEARRLLDLALRYSSPDDVLRFSEFLESASKPGKLGVYQYRGCKLAIEQAEQRIEEATR